MDLGHAADRGEVLGGGPQHRLELFARRVDLTHPDLASLRAQVQQAQQVQAQAQAQIGARHDQGHSQLKSLQLRLQAIQYEVPDFGSVEVKKGSRLEAIVKTVNAMNRSVNSAFQDATAAIDNVGSIDAKTNKPYGLLRENWQILDEMQAPLNTTPIPSDSIALFSSYPRTLAELSTADADMIRSIDAGRAAAMQLDSGLADLDAFFKQLQQIHLNAFGEVDQFDYTSLLPYMQKATASLGAAAISASQANQLYNLARARQLSARITMLGVGASPQRYDTLQKAINLRFNNDDIDYIGMLHDNVTPGELTAATIVAADFRTTPQAIIREAHETHRTVIDVANARGMHALALEVFMGLIYLDYTDDPYKEAHPDGTATNQNVGV